MSDVNKSRLRVVPVTTLVVAAIVGTSAGLPAEASAKKTLTLSGSTSVFPLAKRLAKRYVKVNRKVKFKIAQGGSDVGVADAAAGRVSIGMSSRDPKPTDPGGIRFNKFARDSICLIVNPSNSVRNLSAKTVQGIFGGRIRRWSQVPGSNRTGTIDTVLRSAPSGTQDAFEKLFMGDVKPRGTKKASSGQVEAAVRRDKDAIGYVSLAFKKGVKDLRYKGVKCNLRNSKSGQYAGTRNFFWVTRGKPRGNKRKFIRWSRKSKRAQRIIARGWVPLR